MQGVDSDKEQLFREASKRQAIPSSTRLLQKVQTLEARRGGAASLPPGIIDSRLGAHSAGANPSDTYVREV